MTNGTDGAKREATGEPPRVSPAAEGAIVRAKQELEEMIDRLPLSMLLVTRDGVVTRANRSLLGLLQIDGFRDVLGHRLPALFPGADPRAFAPLLRIQTGYHVECVTARMADGTDHTLRFTALALGAERSVQVMMVEDATGALGQAEEEQRRLKRDAVTALMGSLMHNINQPLTVIMVRARLSLLELEKAEPDIEEVRRSLREIMDFTTQASERLSLFERPRDFVTEPYVGGVDILDIERSR